MARSLILAFAFLLGCPVADTGDWTDDDDATGDDDDDATGDDDDACGLASNGTGGAEGVGWITVDGFSTPNDGSSDYEVMVYDPPTRDPSVPAPLIQVVGRRMPYAHAENEDIVLNGLGWKEEADNGGFVVALTQPGDPLNNQQLNWTDSATDREYFPAALDAVAALWNVDLDRVHLLGSSAGGSAAMLLGHRHAELVASIANHAGRNPFEGQWPDTPWEWDVGAIFIHDEGDPIVSRAAVQDGVDMWQDAMQRTETYFDYDRGHEYVPELLHPAMLGFFETVCNDRL